MWVASNPLDTASSDTSSVLGNGYFYGKEFADLIKAGTLNPFSLTQTDAALSALKAISANGATLYGGHRRRYLAVYENRIFRDHEDG